MTKKVLIISHNVFGKSSSMGRTLAGFFHSWQIDSIAQLYFHKEIPTTDICENYFCITDFEILKKKKREIGTVLTKTDIRADLSTERIDTGVETKAYKMGSKRKPYMYIGRNLIWASNKWKNERLLKWINKFNPDLIFFAASDYVFSYEVAMEIAKYKKIPIVTYVCDDYYFAKRASVSPLYYINRFHYTKTLKKLFLKHKNVIAICDKITDEYQKEFGVLSETIMTASSLCAFEKKEENKKIVISYLGNMGYKRHLQLIEIGRALLDVTNGEVMLNVYSGEKKTDILMNLTKENGINFCGSVSYDEVIEIMKKSDILVHTESFDKVIRDKVRYSVSTKIADSLSCGRCLFAYGPSDVASIEYLKENDCACVVTEADNLKEKLRQIICDYDLRCKYIGNALKTAQENHNLERNSIRFYEFMQKVAEENIQ